MTVAEAFSHIYANRVWSKGSTEEFNSGDGSGIEFTAQYWAFLKNFIRNKSIGTVVDLGCGDFRVGRMIADAGLGYIGADVVPELIAYNTRHFGTDQVSFRCLDITRETVPDGDLCLIRQVFQHLSNSEIIAALGQCGRFRYVLVSEHLPILGPVKPNLDKPHGPDIRLYRNSGVFLDAPPFSQHVQTVLEVPVDSRSVIRTVLIEKS